MTADVQTLLIEAKERVRRKRKLEGMLAETQCLLQEQQKSCSMHGDRVVQEKRDVDDLEGFTLTKLFYSVLGTKEERLDKERQEYLAAKLKYESAQAMVAATENDQKKLQTELKEVASADADYERALEEKRRFLVGQEGTAAAQLLTLAERMANLDADAKELNEAIFAGEAARSALDSVQANLNSAQNWGVLDIMGGGLIATMAKHSKIDDAKNDAQLAQHALLQFREELAEAGQRPQASLEVDGFSKFADYFFDGLIIDWMVQSQIQNASTSCTNAISQVDAAVAQCRRRLDNVVSDSSKLSEERRSLIERS
jgi:hypothetical protein